MPSLLLDASVFKKQHNIRNKSLINQLEIGQGRPWHWEGNRNEIHYPCSQPAFSQLGVVCGGTVVATVSQQKRWPLFADVCSSAPYSYEGILRENTYIPYNIHPFSKTHQGHPSRMELFCIDYRGGPRIFRSQEHGKRIKDTCKITHSIYQRCKYLLVLYNCHWI